MSKKTKLEVWLNLHNHKMELLRTLFGFLALTLQLIILALLLSSCGIATNVYEDLFCSDTNQIVINGLSYTDEKGLQGYTKWGCSSSPTIIDCFEYASYETVIHELVHAVTEKGNEYHIVDNNFSFFSVPAGRG